MTANNSRRRFRFGHSSDWLALQPPRHMIISNLHRFCLEKEPGRLTRHPGAKHTVNPTSNCAKDCLLSGWSHGTITTAYSEYYYAVCFILAPPPGSWPGVLICWLRNPSKRSRDPCLCPSLAFRTRRSHRTATTSLTYGSKQGTYAIDQRQTPTRQSTGTQHMVLSRRNLPL